MFNRDICLVQIDFNSIRYLFFIENLKSVGNKISFGSSLVKFSGTAITAHFTFLIVNIVLVPKKTSLAPVAPLLPITIKSMLRSLITALISGISKLNEDNT